MMKMKFENMVKSEGVVRVLTVLILVLGACLVGSNSQTKVILIRKTATFKDLEALYISLYIYCIGAAYNLLRVCNNCFHGNFKGPNLPLAWAALFFDQIMVYLTYGVTTAATQASIIAITGQNNFQWMKLCNRFTRFCIQMGGAMVCGYLACFLMILITSFSAFNLFSHYSPKQFLLLKPIISSS
ncbi:hypothetical protein CsatA_003270 [Cannabis sativa]